MIVGFLWPVRAFRPLDVPIGSREPCGEGLAVHPFWVLVVLVFAPLGGRLAELDSTAPAVAA